jgi:choline dehydrogenase-like flavoprotein
VTDPNPSETSADVLIIGAGIMGAIVAAQVRESRPTATIMMVDAGPPIGEAFGHHLHDTPDGQARRAFAVRADRANQEKYLRSTAESTSADPDRVMPGMRPLSALGHDTSEMPGASVGWNVGGMSVHWAAATPTPYGSEIPAETSEQEWAEDLRRARELLRVHDGPYPLDVVGDAVLAAIDELLGPVTAPGRHPQAMPVAMQPGADGTLRRTGPGAVFPPIEVGGDDAFRLQHSTVALRLLVEGGRVSGAVTRRTDGTEESTVRAGVVVVCADTFRTPQLLFASGLGGPAVGGYLNEHAFLAGAVVVDLDRLGVRSAPAHLEGEWFTSASWVPHSGEAQPFQVQVMQTPVPAAGSGPDAYVATLAMYIPTQVRAENRIEFSEKTTDILGLPLMTVHYDYSASDLASIERARVAQARLADGLGEFDPTQPPTLLPRGSSLHYTGTARSGARDDGTSVCDPDGRVWGVTGLLVAGNAVVPTALVANSTLAGAVTAVRAGRAAASEIGGDGA